jgi:two-component system KDP operon response regulator KdpE
MLQRNSVLIVDDEDVMRSIWGPEYSGELEYLRAYVRMLLKKIESDPENPKYILTEAWLFYRFCDRSSAES